MKKLVTAAIVVALSVAATSAMAGIKNSKHDLSTGATGNLSTLTGGSNQICIYCHTPHNASPAIPLWNRGAATNSGYTFYSSPSMKLKGQGAKTAFETTSTSLQCMSCHNGVDGLGAGIVRQGAEPAGAIVGAAGAISGDKIASGNALLGQNLGNDHPVNIRMLASTAGLFDPSANTIGNGLTDKLPLFNGTGGANYIECGSCHAVHDATHGKFLRTSNKGSILCLACHNK